LSQIIIIIYLFQLNAIQNKTRMKNKLFKQMNLKRDLCWTHIDNLFHSEHIQMLPYSHI